MCLEHREGELREEVVQANQLRKQQLVELGLLREEEKQNMTRDHELEVGGWRLDDSTDMLLTRDHEIEVGWWCLDDSTDM